MLDSLSYVQEAKAICIDANTKSLALIERSKSVKVKLEYVGDLNAKSITAIHDLIKDGGGEIKEAIELAKNVDDLVEDCSGKVVNMITRVKEGFRNIPVILTEGIQGKNKMTQILQMLKKILPSLRPALEQSKTQILSMQLKLA